MLLIALQIISMLESNDSGCAFFLLKVGLFAWKTTIFKKALLHQFFIKYGNQNYYFSDNTATKINYDHNILMK